MSSRSPLGIVVEVKGNRILLNLENTMKSYVSSGLDGVTEISQPSDLFVVDAGSDLIVCRVEELYFAEPKTVSKTEMPLRQLSAIAIGRLTLEAEGLVFNQQSWKLPNLGAKAYAMKRAELQTVVTVPDGIGVISLGQDAKSEMFDVNVRLDDFLSRHVAVLGSTGQGKTNFISQINQTILERNKNARIIIFDINGEYSRAFSKIDEQGNRTKIPDWATIKVTKIGQKPSTLAAGNTVNYLQIPYYALGRQGIIRLLMPSDKTQMPALRYALEHLSFVKDNGDQTVSPFNNLPTGAKLRNDGAPNEGANDAAIAKRAIEVLRGINSGPNADSWPSLNAISCLCAEWASLELGRSGQQRSAFNYSNVQPMIARIHALTSDSRFQEVINISGGDKFSEKGNLNLSQSSRQLVEEIFGSKVQNSESWNVHILDLSAVTSDLMPYVVSPLLEAYADVLFSRGPNSTHPTLLVLEEAHHYLKQAAVEDSSRSTLAYERLAKEGRKFNLSLMLSTQRPSELSPSVLSQCGTWCVMRLTNESDLRTLQSATDSSEKVSFARVSSLMRGYAYVFGSSIRVPTIVKTKLADPEPNSHDAPFASKWLN
jgi:uncharacterized protein